MPLVEWMRRRRPNAESVVDYGCGDGLLASMLGEGWKVQGYDPSPLARDAARTRGLEVHESVASVAASGPVDMVVLSSVAQYLGDESELIEVVVQAAGWLSDGGCVVVTDMVVPGSTRLRDVADLMSSTGRRFGARSALNHLMETARRSHGPLLRVEPDRLAAALSEEGLVVERLRSNLSTLRGRVTVVISSR